MIRILSIVAALGVAMIFFSELAKADPGAGVWTAWGSTNEAFNVGAGEAVTFNFPSGTADSTLIKVTSDDADICFDDDTTGTGGTGRATVFMALTVGGDSNAAITLPALVLTNDDCNPIVSGHYWVEIDTAATASENPVVVIFGR